MEYIHGESLTDWIRRRGPLTWPEFRSSALALLSAVNALHAAGGRHRDIKPDNVRVEEGSGRIVLVDFGVVGNEERAEADPFTNSHDFLGTIRWSAPEWVYRDPPEAARSPALDVYGVGVTFYYMITGSEPFPGINNRAQLEVAVREKAIRFRPDGFPRDVQSCLNATLSKQVDQRPGVEALSRAIASAPDDATRVSPQLNTPTIAEIFSGDDARLAKQRADAAARQYAEFQRAKTTPLT